MKTLILAVALGVFPALLRADPGQLSDLSTLTPGRTAAVNALWNENPLSVQFKSSRRVVVADLKGPAEITMIHFAEPQNGSLGRELLLRIYWDGESSPSVECPLVDFFCDPNGTRDVVSTAMLNVRRGFNAYFPMPFRKSARIEIEYQGPVPPGDKLWAMMPCYSYVCYRTLAQVPADTGYFCASWRQQTLKLGLHEYVALDATGRGKFIGWNITVRQPGTSGYPVDENEKFYIDGESSASVEFQGLEDSFGFSWGFPPGESMLPYTGYFPFMKGAAAYRFFLQDSIGFEKSLKVKIGFGVHEDPYFRTAYSAFGNSLQFSSTVYWYQAGPHAPLPAMPPPEDRAPAPEILHWPDVIDAPTAEEYRKQGVKLVMLCGLPNGEIAFAQPGYSISEVEGQGWNGWSGEVSYCLSDDKGVALTLNVPKGGKGTVRLYIVDPDRYMGGREETIAVGGRTVGTFENFQQGRWVEAPVAADQTGDGKVKIRFINDRPGSNAVVSKVEWTEGRVDRANSGT